MAKGWAKQFYNSGEWLVTRGIALRRDHFTCQICSGRAEEVHHLIELTPTNIHDRNITLNIENLQSLCRRCHSGITHNRIEVRQGLVFDVDGQVSQVE